MVRKQEQKEDFEKRGISTVLADLEEDVSHATKNASRVIFAAGSNGKNVKAVDQEGAKRFIDAASNSDAKKFVMLSSMGADNPSEGGDMEDYFRAKHNADEHLRESGLNYSIVRPGALTDENGTGEIRLKEKMGDKGEIARADVAKTLIEVLQDKVRNKQTFEIISGDVAIEKAVVS
jgi:uncharacterized protein YbjT (DUF2867 family)